MATRSLKRQLLLWLLTPLLLIVPAVALLQYLFILEPAIQEFDDQLADITIAVADLLREDDGVVRLEMTPQTERSLRTDRHDDVYYVAVGPDREILAGHPALFDATDRVATGQWLFRDQVLDAKPVRVAIHGVACAGGTCEVRVAETLVKRESLQSQAQRLTLGLAALFSGLVIATMWVAVTYSLRPLRYVRDELEHRSLHNLSRLDPRRAPAEIEPLVTTVNQLFDRLDVAAAAQRAFVSDAAHQLRTPLAALRTETELAMLEPHPESMRPILSNLRASADRAARLASQLLTLARLDPEAHALSKPVPVDLMDVAADAAREWSARAFEVDADLGFDLEPATVSGQHWLLREALFNLVDNALKYCPRPAHITVRTRVRNGIAELEVEDDGPGIPPAERERVLQRFVRGRDPEGQGSGLGLSIVAQIAELHRATLGFEVPDGGRGLRVRMAFPVAADAPPGRRQA